MADFRDPFSPSSPWFSETRCGGKSTCKSRGMGSNLHLAPNNVRDPTKSLALRVFIKYFESLVSPLHWRSRLPRGDGAILRQCVCLLGALSPWPLVFSRWKNHGERHGCVLTPCGITSCGAGAWKKGETNTGAGTQPIGQR